MVFLGYATKYIQHIFITPSKKHCTHQQSVSISSSPQPQQQLATFYFCRFACLGISYKWNHKACGLLRLASFSQDTVFKVSAHVVACISNSFLLMFTVHFAWLFHISFSHSSLDGHLQCIQSLTMINCCGAWAFCSSYAQALERAGSLAALQALLPLGMWDLSSPTWE